MFEMAEAHREAARAALDEMQKWCSEDIRRAECVEIVAAAVAASADAERARWLDAVPAHVGEWVDAVAEESGYDLSAPLVVLLRRLTTLRADGA